MTFKDIYCALHQDLPDELVEWSVAAVVVVSEEENDIFSVELDPYNDVVDSSLAVTVIVMVEP